MEREAIILGQKYKCHPIGLKNQVSGEVIKKLENCVIFCVEDYNSEDHLEIQEKCGKVVAKYENIYEIETMIETVSLKAM